MRRRWLGITITAALVMVATSATADPASDDNERDLQSRDKDCLICHAGVGEEDAPKLDMEVYGASVHAEEGCIGCHADVEDESIKHEEEDEDLAPAVCNTCHEEPQSDYDGSIHADADAAREADADQATCASCHGSHDMVPVESVFSVVHPLQQYETCGGCHENVTEARGHLVRVRDEHRALLSASQETLLEAMMAEGELIDAGCSDCHGSHRVLAHDDEDSPFGPKHTLTTCVSCHEDITNEFSSSAHGNALGERAEQGLDHTADSDDEGDVPEEPPVCVSCHFIHSNPYGGDLGDPFRVTVVNECGTCHEELYDTFAESYHGKATELGGEAVAKCADCHGTHGIQPADEPTSMISDLNRLDTCQQCHEGAPAGFAEFWSHADPHRRDLYPALFWVYLFMTTLLISVFTFFGVHTLLWGIRDSIDAVREIRDPVPEPPESPSTITRFALFHRLTHLAVIISFLGLAATGAPLKYAKTDWAKAIFNMLGGVESAGWWHRFFAVITFGYFVAHVAFVWRRLYQHFRNKSLKSALLGPDSLIPSMNDLRDVAGQFRWFFGRGPQPRWDRWTYWEKFDYWAVFWGIAIIGTSGLILWFPTFFTAYVPGWAVNIALVVHSDEALLAMGFIFGVHFFNSHLRRDKFPMDAVMFTGTVPEEDYRHERPREWERLEAEGEVQGRLAKHPRPVFVAWARVFGISCWLFGLLILALIIHGFLSS